MPKLEIEDVLRKIETIALPFANAAGLELVELKGHYQGHDVNVEILADYPAGGIGIEECAKLNRSVAEAIDADGFLGENYTLEVNSPGLDRPLKTKKDFARSLNYEIRFFLKERFEGKMEYAGKLMSVDNETLTVGLKKKNTIVLPMALVDRGLLVL